MNANDCLNAIQALPFQCNYTLEIKSQKHEKSNLKPMHRFNQTTILNGTTTFAEKNDAFRLVLLLPSLATYID